MTEEPGVVCILFPLFERGLFDQCLQRINRLRRDVQDAEKFGKRVIGIVDQLLERERMMRVAHAEEIGELPDIIEKLIRMLGGALVEKGKMISQVAAPFEQVELVVRSEVAGLSIGRERFDVRQRRAPLVTRMAIEMDNPRVGKISPE